MTANELLAYQIDDAGFQLQQTFEGLGDGDMDHRPAPSAMTAREILEHLSEAYQATITHEAGGEHSWGTFKVEDKSKGNLLSVWSDLRSRASQAVLAKGDDEGALKNGCSYIIGHDYYHVGQMATIRLSLDRSWNAYSIYRS